MPASLLAPLSLTRVLPIRGLDGMGALGQRLRKHAFSAIAGQLFPEVLRYLVANPGNSAMFAAIPRASVSGFNRPNAYPRGY